MVIKTIQMVGCAFDHVAYHDGLVHVHGHDVIWMIHYFHIVYDHDPSAGVHFPVCCALHKHGPLE
jgi:hypothetical protein